MAPVEVGCLFGSVVAAAGAQGNFELNAMRPVIINNVLHSARILADASDKRRRFSIEGTTLDEAKIGEYVGRSLMLVTALSPHIGYDKASAIAHRADREGSSLRKAALALGVTAPTSTGSSTQRRWWANRAAISVSHRRMESDPESAEFTAVGRGRRGH